MTTKPRVLYLSSWPLGAHGEGAVSFVYEQIAALSEHVAALFVEHRFDGALGWVRRRTADRDVEPIADLWPDRVTALRVWTPRWSPRLTHRRLLDDVWRAGAIVAARVRRKWGAVDLVHAHVVLPAGLLGAAVAQALGVPLVLQEHSGPFDMHLDTAEKRSAVQRTLARASVTLAVSDVLAQRMLEMSESPGKVQIVPNLVRTDLFLAQPAVGGADPLRIVSVAALHPVKGVDTLLRAIAELIARGRTVHAEIIGEGEMRGSLEDLTRQLGLSRVVTFRGAVPRAVVGEHLAAAHIYVCSSRHETFGLAPAEALSVGRPVVSTRCGGPESFVTQSFGALVPADDPSAMADAIAVVNERLAEFDPGRMHETIERRFGPEAFRRQMLSVYSGLLGDRVAA